jgi:hypothetical protein
MRGRREKKILIKKGNERKKKMPALAIWYKCPVLRRSCGRTILYWVEGGGRVGEGGRVGVD